MRYEELVPGRLVSDGSCVRKLLFVHDKGVLTEIVKDNHTGTFNWNGVVTYFPKADLEMNVIRYWRAYNEPSAFFVFLNKKKSHAWKDGSCHYFTTREAAEEEREYFKKLGDDTTSITETVPDYESRAG